MNKRPPLVIFFLRFQANQKFELAGSVGFNNELQKTVKMEEPAKPGNLKKLMPLIGIVGPCGAGKSTLAQGLRDRGFQARAIVQEHSYVQDMWKRITNPDILIFLQATCGTGARRRRLNWTESEWEEQQRRLSHAQKHADLSLETDSLKIDEVLDLVLEFLATQTQAKPGG